MALICNILFFTTFCFKSDFSLFSGWFKGSSTLYTHTFMFVIPLPSQISEKRAYNFNTAKTKKTQRAKGTSGIRRSHIKFICNLCFRCFRFRLVSSLTTQHVLDIMSDPSQSTAQFVFIIQYNI